MSPVPKALNKRVQRPDLPLLRAFGRADDRSFATAHNWPVSAPSEADLNLLYSAALEFGLNWRRPLNRLASERMPDRAESYRNAVALLVEQSRAEIEAYINDAFTRSNREWHATDAGETETWIAERFPWMTPRNRTHGISQGVYYAWHG